MKIRRETNPITSDMNKTFIVCLALMLCGWNASATQYVMPGGAGDFSGASWANAQSNVQAAVDAAVLPGEEVWVAAGRYELSNPLILRSESVLLGGFAGDEMDANTRDWDTNITILDGLDATQAVSMVSITNALLDGLVVTRGNFAVAKGMGGGGIRIERSEGCEVANCKILHNTTTRAPGASSCEGGGVFIYQAANCVVENCLFTDNRSAAYGTSLAIISSSGITVKKCRFVGCYHTSANGVVRLKSNSNLSFVNCLASGNKAYWGGFIYASQAINAINCTACFTSNKEGIGAAFQLLSNCLLRNNLIAFNEPVAVWEHLQTCDPTIENNLFHGQSEGDYYDFDQTNVLTGADEINTNTLPDRASGNVDGDPQFVRCPTQDDGTWTAVGTYDQERTQTTLVDTGATFRPGALKGRFLNPNTAETLYRHAEIAENTATSITVWGEAEWAGTGNGYRIYDYRLRSNSPAINAGLATGAPETDLNGNPRPALGGIDIGAYEAQPALGTMILAQ